MTDKLDFILYVYFKPTIRCFAICIFKIRISLIVSAVVLNTGSNSPIETIDHWRDIDEFFIRLYHNSFTSFPLLFTLFWISFDQALRMFITANPIILIIQTNRL